MLSNSNVYCLTAETIYDSISQNYYNIIMINQFPKGPLKYFVKQIRPNNRFPFQQNNYGSCQKCGLALLKMNDPCMYPNNKYNNNKYMTPHDIPDLFSFLVSNGYTIDTKITKMMNSSEIKINNNKLIAFVSYTNK